MAERITLDAILNASRSAPTNASRDAWRRHVDNAEPQESKASLRDVERIYAPEGHGMTVIWQVLAKEIGS